MDDDHEAKEKESEGNSTPSNDVSNAQIVSETADIVASTVVGCSIGEAAESHAEDMTNDHDDSEEKGPASIVSTASIDSVAEPVEETYQEREVKERDPEPKNPPPYIDAGALPKKSFSTQTEEMFNEDKEKAFQLQSGFHNGGSVYPEDGFNSDIKKLDNRRSCKLFRGAIADFRKRFPHYCSDFTDAAQYRCAVSIVFMFFASVAPSITFGGLMGKYTEEKMGMTETLLAQAVCGILWGLFACQPIMIQSATGPVLIFEYSLNNLCNWLALDLLTVRFFAGIWILIICIVVVAFDGSRLLHYVTRFTEEIFAVLISGIFIFESLNFIRLTNHDNPVENYGFYEEEHRRCNQSTMHMEPCHYGEPNTTLLTGMILFTTFAFAYILRAIRQSVWFGKHVRNSLGDFGVFIAISLVAVITHFMFPDPVLARLEMPEKLNFTNPIKRGHGLFVIPKVDITECCSCMVLSWLAALLVFILLFVETEITEILLSRKERCLVKGTGLNWDLLMVGICSFICSIFGIPWMCAAAVQSLAHCSSLTITKRKAVGEPPIIERVIEQRVTTICVSLLIGAFAFLGSNLRLPMASLFGVFLYLGVMNLVGVQLVKRMLLFFIPVKYFPKTPYTNKVKVTRLHLYTGIQLLLVIIISVVKQVTITALAFPFILILFIVFRQTLIPLLFTQEELQALDGEEDTEPADENGNQDHYAVAPLPV